MFYTSTRDKQQQLTASQAILQGIAQDGGLFVPNELPKMTFDWQQLSQQSYQQIAELILAKFLTDYTAEEIAYCVKSAYDDKFDTEEIAPIKQVGSQYILELFHGNTIAFKDMALSILPYLMTVAAKKNNLTEKIVILTATSGDTGKAAMAGFADVDNTQIIVFYPKDGVSQIQERQMITQKGNNTHVVAIKGNFDDAQTMVKNLFADQELATLLKSRGYQFSSANSINIGRLVPQIVYYVYTYAQLIKQQAIQIGDKINITVPTGNFGNILAAHYAKQIGVPINKLICASNDNNVLVDFFNKGIYDKQRPFVVTSSPSMDILVSSNLERLVYQLAQEDTQITAHLMQQLADEGHYHISQEMHAALQDYYADFATEAQTAQEIADQLTTHHYLMDPHTAVAANVAKKYQQQTQDVTPMVIVSTASPYKFPRSVVEAVETVNDEHDFELIETIQRLSQVPVPAAVTSIINAEILHHTVVEVEDMKQSILNILS